MLQVFQSWSKHWTGWSADTAVHRVMLPVKLKIILQRIKIFSDTFPASRETSWPVAALQGHEGGASTFTYMHCAHCWALYSFKNVRTDTSKIPVSTKLGICVWLPAWVHLNSCNWMWICVHRCMVWDSGREAACMDDWVFSTDCVQWPCVYASALDCFFLHGWNQL